MMATKRMMQAGLFAALMAVSSQISIPFGPVPVTLQVLVVLLSGVVLGSRWSVGSLVIWMLLGVAGLPVFAQGKAGAAVLLGPTGGFMFGFLLCAFIVGRICAVSAELEIRRVLPAMFAGLAAMYLCGYLGFMASFAWFLNKPMTWDQAFALSVVPFLPVDALKAAAAAYMGVKVRHGLLRAGLYYSK